MKTLHFKEWIDGIALEKDEQGQDYIRRVKNSPIEAFKNKPKPAGVTFQLREETISEWRDMLLQITTIDDVGLLNDLAKAEEEDAKYTPDDYTDVEGRNYGYNDCYTGNYAA